MSNPMMLFSCHVTLDVRKRKYGPTIFPVHTISHYASDKSTTLLTCTIWLMMMTGLKLKPITEATHKPITASKWVPWTSNYLDQHQTAANTMKFEWDKTHVPQKRVTIFHEFFMIYSSCFSYYFILHIIHILLHWLFTIILLKIQIAFRYQKIH